MILTVTLWGLVIGAVAVSEPLPDGMMDVLFVLTSSSLAYGIAWFCQNDRGSRRGRRRGRA